MSIKCLMNGLEVNYPCSPVCALFGDCVTAFEAQKKENVRTNADRIRAMSDEELVVFLDRFSGRCLDCAENAKNKSCQIYKEGHYCRPRDIMEWLQQTAEEARHEKV